MGNKRENEAAARAHDATQRLLDQKVVTDWLLLAAIERCLTEYFVATGVWRRRTEVAADSSVRKPLSKKERLV